MSGLGHKRTYRTAIAMSALPPKADMTPASMMSTLTPKADIHWRILVFMSVSHPAAHPLNVAFISCSELTAHLGFLEGDVDPISGGEDGDRRNEHWPSADP